MLLAAATARSAPQVDTLERCALARTAARLVPSGARIGLGGGSSMRVLAHELARRGRLSVVTTALDVALELAPASGVELTVTAGEAVPGTPHLTGPESVRALEPLHLDVAVIQADGVTGDVVSVTDSRVGATIRALVERANRLIVLADSRAVGRLARFPVADSMTAHPLVAYASAGDPTIEAYARSGIDIALAR